MSRAGAVGVTLPTGLLDGNVRHGEALVRPLTGRDEEALVASAGQPRAARVSRLLARCVLRLGTSGARPGLDRIRSLRVGDREALLLHVRRATLGARIDCVLVCPAPSCAERMDIPLDSADLLLSPYHDPAQWYETSLSTDAQARRVRFRLPTGRDQEAVAAIASKDPVGAARALLERCLAPGEDGSPPALDEAAATQVAERMAELDAQAELRLDLTCPHCGARVQTLLDVATCFIDEITARVSSLFDDVHTLATWYHWSEAAILGLSVPRRRRYLELIASRAEAPASWGAA